MAWPPAMTLQELHRAIRRSLEAAGIAEAALDARLIVEYGTGTTRLDLVREPSRPVSPAEGDAVAVAVARRLAGEPVHRILGRREFYGLDLALSPDTLEPRPDTEILVDLALPRLGAIAARRGACRVLDLGTGTGAIALAVLSAVPQARVVAVDVAPGALDTAVDNARAAGLDGRFEPLLSDWFEKTLGAYDAILSNPPYISDREYGELPREVRDHDPFRALHGGEDGLDAYRRIADGAAERLEPGGFVGLEIGSRQKAAVVALFQGRGFVLEGEATDLAGRDRALVFGLK
jgi:release factor glutamine methyltransferase